MVIQFYPLSRAKLNKKMPAFILTFVVIGVICFIILAFDPQ